MLEFRGRSKRGDPGAARAKTEEAFARFNAGRQLRDANEATTRVELIDRVLDALGWTADTLTRETATCTGDFLDYELWVDRERWCILEAKRTGATFELPAVTPYASVVSLSRLLQTGGRALKDALAQAARYCNDRGVPLACVSNGYQWLFFRGLSAERHPWSGGSALVFRGTDEVLTRFDEFYCALSRDRAGTHHIFSLIERQAPASPPVAAVPRDLIRTTIPQLDSETTSQARTVCDYLLADIYGDARKDMLERCYVEPGVSEEFERSIQVLLRDSANALDVSAEQLVESNTSRFADEVSRHGLTSTREPVLVIGHVGAGKTTFLHRAMHRLRTDRTAITVLLDLEGRGRGGTISATAEEQHVCSDLLNKLQNSAGTVLKNNDAPTAAMENANPFSPRTLRSLFSRELKTERELSEALWHADENSWLRREHEVLVQLRGDSYVVLTRYLRHLAGHVRRADRSAYPMLLVLDNLDQATDEYQRCMYGLALRIAKSTTATLVLCIREDTFVRGREPGGFLTSSTLPLVFHVAAPSFSRVLRQRIKFAELQADSGALPPLVKHHKGSVVGVCGILRSVLLAEKSQALELLACLAAQSVRDSLALARCLVLGSVARQASAQPTAAYALESFLASGSGIGRRGPLHLFNCFDATPAEPPAHALRSRLLAYLSWAHDQSSDRALIEASTTVVARFASWGYPTRLVIGELEALIAGGQVRPFSESERGATAHIDPLPPRVTITAPGHAHLSRLLLIPAYRAAMACVTRWYDSHLCNMFVQKADAAGSSEGPTIADIAESSAMPVFESYLRQAVAGEDDELSRALDGVHWVREVRSRSARLLSLAPIEPLSSEPPSLPVPVASDGGERCQLPLAIPSAQMEPSLATLQPGRTVNDTVWIPRILWALEWARLGGRGPISPRHIAEILTEHGNQSVPSTNVSRAFRESKEYNRKRKLWRVTGKRYEIERAGSELLAGLLRDD